MQPDLAGKRQKFERVSEVDAVGLGAFRDRGAFRLLFAIRLAELDVRTEAAGAKGHVEPGLGIGAQDLGFGKRGRLVAGVGELAGEAAVGIVGAADERAELADLEAETPDVAGRAGPGIAAGALIGKDVRPKQIVQRIEHLGDAQIADVVHRADELAPEVAQHVLPFELAGGDEVELLLKIGGEVVFDIAAEEALEEGGDQAALVLRI